MKSLSALLFLFPTLTCGLNWPLLLAEVNRGDNDAIAAVLGNWNERPTGFMDQLEETGAMALVDGGERVQLGVRMEEWERMQLNVCVILLDRLRSIINPLSLAPPSCKAALEGRTTESWRRGAWPVRNVIPCWASAEGERVLRVLIMVRFNHEPEIANSKFELIHDPASDLGRAQLAEIASKFPRVVARPDMSVWIRKRSGPEMIPNWASLLFEHIRELLTVPVSIDQSPYRKFVWGVGRHVGPVVGMALGKIFQGELRLPYMMQSEAIFMLFHPTDENIFAYYDENYAADQMQYLNRYLPRRPSGDAPDHAIDHLKCPALDKLTFSTLLSPSNIQSAAREERVDTRGLTHENIIRNYFEPLFLKLRNEFKEFVREVTLAMSHSIRLDIVSSLSEPERRQLADMLNAEPKKADDPLGAFHFMEAGEVLRRVPSLVPGLLIWPADVVRSYIKALSSRQLDKFISLFTGGVTDVVEPKSLRIKFVPLIRSAPRVAAQAECPAPPCEGIRYLHKRHSARPEHILIAEGQEYEKVMRRATRAQLKLLGFDSKSQVGRPTSTSAQRTLPVCQVDTFRRTMMVPLQSAEEMIESLIVATNKNTRRSRSN